MFRQPVEVSYKRLAYFGGVLRRNTELLSKITRLVVVQPTEGTCISSFSIGQLLPRLIFFDIEQLDLTIEHRWMDRVPCFRSVRTLQLRHLQTCHLSQLIRFLRAFHSLIKLDIGLHSGELRCNDETLLRRYHSTTQLSTRYYSATQLLTSLLLDVRPGVLELADWCLSGERIRQLHVRYDETFKSRSGGLEKLFDCFRLMRNSLTFFLDTVLIFEGMDIYL